MLELRTRKNALVNMKHEPQLEYVCLHFQRFNRQSFERGAILRYIRVNQ
jgi:hypothetical protein